MSHSKTRRPSFFFIISFVGLLAALIGFTKTFFIPVAAGTFTAPTAIHVHGAFAFTWIMLFVVQSVFIHFGKYQFHRNLGMAGLFIALGVAITMVPAGLFQVQRELNPGLGETAYSSLTGVITSGIMFLGFVLFGVMKRNRPDYHKRFMVLATIVVLWPAWFRFRHYFPSIPNPEIWFALVLADSLIVISWIWEKIKYGFVHPVLLYGGLFIILEQTFEVIMFDTAAWRIVGKWIYHLLV